MGKKEFSRRSFIRAFSLPLFIPGATAISDTPDLQKLAILLKEPHPATWVFTGDSITQGAHHTYNGRCYPEVISERVRWELRRISDVVINSGVNGTNTKYLLDNFQWYVARFQPAVVSVMYGCNDCQEKAITAAAFGEYLTEIIQKVRQQNAIPILQTPNGMDMQGILAMKTAPRTKLPEYVSVMRAVATQQQCILVDHWKLWNAEPFDLMKAWIDDPMHPNAEGHLQLARLFFKMTGTYDETSFVCSGKK